jgi:hypothetical protein
MKEDTVLLAFRWTEFQETFGSWQNIFLALAVGVFLAAWFLVIWLDFRARAARRAERKLEESDWWQETKNRLAYQLQEGEIPCPKCKRPLNPTTDRITDPGQEGCSNSDPVLLRCMWCTTVTEYPRSPVVEAR